MMTQSNNELSSPLNNNDIEYIQYISNILEKFNESIGNIHLSSIIISLRDINPCDNIFRGTDGDDQHYGGKGDDTFLYSAGFDSYNGGEGVDTLDFSSYLPSQVHMNSGLTPPINNPISITFSLKEGFVWSVNDYNKWQSEKITNIENIISGKTDDMILGDDLDNEIHSDDGRDYLFGDLGNDRLYGDGGKDKLEGHLGHDELYGGDDDDYLNGGKGDDTLYGGLGRDTFIFNMNDGQDIIHDFEDGKDIIRLEKFKYYHDFNDLMGHFSQEGEHVVLAFDDENKVRIENITLEQLNADDFHFL